MINAIRREVGPDFIVGLRMVADEETEKGLTREMGVRIAQAVAASGAFDFINLVKGRPDHDARMRSLIPIQGQPSAPHLDFAGDVREVTKFPIFHAAKIADVVRRSPKDGPHAEGIGQ